VKIKTTVAYVVLALALIVMITPPTSWPTAAYLAVAVALLAAGYIFMDYRRKKSK
jgi:L-asparagine transporter-like permease